MKHIAILTGGPSSERGISIKSAQLVASYLDPNKYSYRLIHMNEDGWIEQESGQKVDLNDFTLTVQGVKEWFDFVFLVIHGTPAEDGKIQGYFEYLGIPHSICGTLSAALTFNKQKCKDFLRAFGVPMADSLVIAKGKKVPMQSVLSLGFPMFVKPNNNGSSYGISKVAEEEELEPALTKAFQFDHEVIIEAFMEGREFSCGVVREGDTLHVFPVTEIIPHAEFFTYEAKYEGASDEVTPAQITDDLMQACQELSRKLYTILDCRGMVRFDFILHEGTFKLLEANTVPGLSEASIIPQQARAYGWTLDHLFDVVIDDGMRQFSSSVSWR